MAGGDWGADDEFVIARDAALGSGYTAPPAAVQPTHPSSGDRLDATVRRSPKRQCSEAVVPRLQVEAVVPPLQVWNRSPTSPRKSDSCCYVDDQVKEGVQLPTHLSGSQAELIDEDAYLAKIYPLLPKDQGINFWKRFVDDAQACLEDYNKKNKANFKYKVSFDDIAINIFEGHRLYCHLNFLGEDENGPKLFFGEITFYDDELMKKRVVVPCCCPVSVNADEILQELFPASATYSMWEWERSGKLPNWRSVGKPFCV